MKFDKLSTAELLVAVDRSHPEVKELAERYEALILNIRRLRETYAALQLEADGGRAR